MKITFSFLIQHCSQDGRLFSIVADVRCYSFVVHAALEALGSEDRTDVAFRLYEILETPLISWQVYRPDISLCPSLERKHHTIFSLCTDCSIVVYRYLILNMTRDLRVLLCVSMLEVEIFKLVSSSI
ncbi:hypothetical protein H5410_042233 [Solanum commersonii]|uniref:Uncharacterized protein n=1 Tax=Solanum commersonii TaxID=4109 RepID=A0A9J5XVT4_SOLCO|nr:hypothetical protein H5410_042233 [Solanum commersonii]